MPVPAQEVCKGRADAAGDGTCPGAEEQGGGQNDGVSQVDIPLCGRGGDANDQGGYGRKGHREGVACEGSGAWLHRKPMAEGVVWGLD